MAIAGIGGVLLAAVLVRRQARDELGERWRGLDPAKRRRVLKAIREGRALADPDEARFAVELIERYRRVEKRSTRRTAYQLALVAAEAFLILKGHWASTVMLPLLVVEAIGRASRGRRERMDTALELNVQVIEAWGGTPPPLIEDDAARTRVTPRAHTAMLVRWAYVVWLAVAVSLTVLVAIAGFQRDDVVLLTGVWALLACLLLAGYVLAPPWTNAA